MAKTWKFCPVCANPLQPRTFEDRPLLTCSKDGCNFVDWNSPTVVCAAFVPVDGKILLVQRDIQPFAGQWCLPRGFLQTDESPKAGTRREVAEETGLTVRMVRMLSACNPSPSNFPLNQVTLFYLARVVGGDLHKGSDARDVGWFSIAALPKLCFRSDIQLINEWIAGEHGTLENPLNYK